MRRRSVRICLVAIVVLASSIAESQEARQFALKGVTEFGGGVSFSSVTPVSTGKTGKAATILSVAPFIGYFISDGFELGVNPLGITSYSSEGVSTGTEIRIFVAPSYNFATGPTSHSFVETLLGYTAQSNGSERKGFSWGGRAGLKIAVGGNGLLNIGVQYLLITMNRSGATERSGYNELSIAAGFTLWR
jgi:hypothetical protein